MYSTFLEKSKFPKHLLTFLIYLLLNHLALLLVLRLALLFLLHLAVLPLDPATLLHALRFREAVTSFLVTPDKLTGLGCSLGLQDENSCHQQANLGTYKEEQEILES